MSATLYIFRLVWPFLKELLLGGLTLKEGMKTQKKRVFLLFFVSGLIISLFLIIPKFYTLSQEHIKLEQSVTAANVKRLQDRITELEGKTPQPPGDKKEIVEANTGPEREYSPPVPIEPVKPKHPARPKKLPVAPVKVVEVDNKRKKAYMDFFEKYNE